jgi:acetyltransferase-like isoleucine patch superfamily enzyme
MPGMTFRIRPATTSDGRLRPWRRPKKRIVGYFRVIRPKPFNLLLRQLLGRPTCTIGRGTRLFASTRIINAGDSSHQISIGSFCAVRGELFVFPGTGRISIGDWCFIGEGARVWASHTITIGNRVLIAHNVNVFDNTTHPLSAGARHSQFRAIMTSGHPANVGLSPRGVLISDDVWLGAAVTVLRGVTIGRGAIVGAGSVIVHDVEPWTVVAGSPARVIRRLEPEP